MNDNTAKNTSPKNTSSQPNNKQPYRRPTLTRVALFADQVLGGGCNKITGTGCELTPPVVIS